MDNTTFRDIYLTKTRGTKVGSLSHIKDQQIREDSRLAFKPEHELIRGWRSEFFSVGVPLT
jgi:hypothetical protein